MSIVKMEGLDDFLGPGILHGWRLRHTLVRRRSVRSIGSLNTTSFFGGTEYTLTS